jgi:hypothetical protein
LLVAAFCSASAMAVSCMRLPKACATSMACSSVISSLPSSSVVRTALTTVSRSTSSFAGFSDWPICMPIM